MMWSVPVLAGWILAGYLGVSYIGRRPIKLWLLLVLVSLFAGTFAWWGFLCR